MLNGFYNIDVLFQIVWHKLTGHFTVFVRCWRRIGQQAGEGLFFVQKDSAWQKPFSATVILDPSPSTAIRSTASSSQCWRQGSEVDSNRKWPTCPEYEQCWQLFGHNFPRLIFLATPKSTLCPGIFLSSVTSTTISSRQPVNPPTEDVFPAPLPRAQDGRRSQTAIYGIETPLCNHLRRKNHKQGQGKWDRERRDRTKRSSTPILSRNSWSPPRTKSIPVCQKLWFVVLWLRY